jgi:transportin-1
MRWSKLKDEDEDLVPLLEVDQLANYRWTWSDCSPQCLASVTIAMGASFLPYAMPVFERCCNIVHNSLLQYQVYQQNPEVDEPEKAFLVVALDLLSGLTQGLGMSLEPLISRTQPHLFELLTVCLKHPQAAVRQSAYALVGDLAMNTFPLLKPHMSPIMHELILQLDPEPKVEFVSASNNAAWSVGEVALRYGRDDLMFQQWVRPLIHRLVPSLLHPKAPRSLHENAAVSIGRIGLMHPTLVAPHLGDFAQAWCQALYEIRDNEEKDSAFRGFCTLVQTNPAGIAKVSRIQSYGL